MTTDVKRNRRCRRSGFRAAVCGLFFLFLSMAEVAEAEPRPSRMQRHQLTFQDIRRDYWVHVPRNIWEEESPLLLMLHDGNGSPTQIQRDTGWNKVSAERGFLVVYPEAVRGGWNDGRELSSIRAQRNAVDDVGFLAQVIADVASKYKVDRRRIYAAGASDGALMVFRLACERADLFAGVAAVAGAMSERLAMNCIPTEAMPVVMVNGTRDRVIPWLTRSTRPVSTEMGRLYSAAESARFWARRNGCGENPGQRTLTKVDIQSATAVEEFTFPHCGSGDVVLYGVAGGGHSWPGARASALGQIVSDRVLGKSGFAISATEIIWDFLSKHRK